MTISAAELTAWLGGYLWPFFRIGAMLMAAPLTGSTSVPMRVRLMLALAITAVAVPLLPSVPVVDPLSWPALLIIVQQVIIGVAMGLALQLVFSAVVLGGQVIAMQMGLGFASMVDPANGTQVPVVSQLFVLLTTLLFLAIDGHLIMIQLLVESFQVLPIGVEGLGRDAGWAVAVWGAQVFAGGLWLALPAVAALLVVNFAFGVMSRAAPQLNIFSIGFPVAMMMGFFFIWALLPGVVPQFSALLESGFELLGQLLGPLQGGEAG